MQVETVLLQAVYSTRNFVLNEFFTGVSMLGSATFAIVLIAGIFLADRKEFGKLTSISYGLTAAIVFIMKYSISRPRPQIGQDLLQVATPHAFPSGHTASAFALATMLSYHKPGMKYYFYSLAVLVGFSRIYVGVHFPSDVLVGGLIGYAIPVLVLKYEDEITSRL